MKQPKQKPIDLGQLQSTFDAAKKQFQADSRALEKAKDSYDRSWKAYSDSQQALKDAARAVTTG